MNTERDEDASVEARRGRRRRRRSLGLFSLATFGEEPLSDEWSARRATKKRNTRAAPSRCGRFANLADEPDTNASAVGARTPCPSTTFPTASPISAPSATRAS
jgi:hypothetical protein